MSFIEGLETEKIIASIVMVALALIVRLTTARYVQRRTWAAAEDGRLLLVRVRNITVILLLAGLAVVWAQELRTAAISLVAFAVAAVIAGRELIMAVSGSLIRATSGSFTVGDRVQIGPYRGDVIDHTLLTTTLIEIGPGHVRTGQTVVLPNNILMTEAVGNETRGHEYVLHSFTVPVSTEEWRAAHDILLDAATHHTETFVDEARKQMEARARDYSLSTPIVDAFVLVKPTSTGTVDLTVRLPVPAREAWRVEDAVLRTWLESAEPDTTAQQTS